MICTTLDFNLCVADLYVGIFRYWCIYDEPLGAWSVMNIRMTLQGLHET